VHDDILDFTQDAAQLGKPAFNDLKEVSPLDKIILTLFSFPGYNHSADYLWPA